MKNRANRRILQSHILSRRGHPTIYRTLMAQNSSIHCPLSLRGAVNTAEPPVVRGRCLALLPTGMGTRSVVGISTHRSQAFEMQRAQLPLYFSGLCLNVGCGSHHSFGQRRSKISGGELVDCLRYSPIYPRLRLLW